MSLLAEIQADALSDTTPVSTLLRKVLVLASNLESVLLEDWVKHEMNGYPKDIEVPEYRQMGIQFKANVMNVIRFYKGMPIAPYVVRKATGKDDIALFKCRQAIGSINTDEIAKSDGAMAVNFDDIGILVQRHLSEGHVVHSFWGEVPASQILGIIEAVRNRVLDFALNLKKEYPDAGEIDGLSAKTPEVEAAVTNIYNNTIHGNVGVAGSAANSTINITVNNGNLQDLRTQLTAHGIEASDVEALEKAIAADPKPTDKKFGPSVRTWIGTMIKKATDGVWNVGLQTGAAVLEKALLGYYGLDK